MLRIIPVPIILLAAACGGQSDEEALRNAAEVSDPAAAEVLNEAAEAGIPPQEALEMAGEAQVQSNLQVDSSIQARPNLPQDPNRPPAGQPVDTVDVDRGQGNSSGNSQ